ncbi:hypothetical protein BJF90_23475 [Pseudonocardia sp. CNS-004]|nr:hypothetical protein BJF90_23475 [Pseudonocardia sp. CNS-004]
MNCAASANVHHRSASVIAAMSAASRDRSMSAGFHWRPLPLVNNRIGNESKLIPPRRRLVKPLRSDIVVSS